MYLVRNLKFLLFFLYFGLIQSYSNFDRKLSIYTPNFSHKNIKYRLSSYHAINNEFVIGLLSGATSRIAKEIILHPLDTIRARKQSNLTSLSNSADANSFIIWGTPINSLYNGLITSLIGNVPSSSLFFGLKDFFKEFLSDNTSMNKYLITVISLFLTNIPYWVIRTPPEIIKTNQQIDYQFNNESLKIQFEYFIKTFNFTEFQNIYFANFIYATPTDIVKFMSYQLITEFIFHQDATKGKVEGLNSAVSGALAGLTSQIITSPLDVARTRIMIYPESSENKRNTFKTIQTIQKNEGTLALFSGIAPKILRAILGGGIQFFTYEITRNYFHS